MDWRAGGDYFRLEFGNENNFNGESAQKCARKFARKMTDDYRAAGVVTAARIGERGWAARPTGLAVGM